jgi:sporulation protein YlmC with PRC-barrel domain
MTQTMDRINVDRVTLSASSLIGDDVVNQQGEKLGSVKDIMIDLERGAISYTVLETGEFLGMGGKYFAVPFNAYKVDGNNKRLILNASKEQFKNDEGFEKNNWPDFSSQAFGERTHRNFGTTPYWERS